MTKRNDPSHHLITQLNVLGHSGTRHQHTVAPRRLWPGRAGALVHRSYSELKPDGQVDALVISGEEQGVETYCGGAGGCGLPFRVFEEGRRGKRNMKPSKMKSIRGKINLAGELEQGG